jgi:hypothetical protein
VVEWEGKPALMYYEGVGAGPLGRTWYHGSWHIMSTEYEELATISAGNGYHADVHDILLRDDGTAVVQAYAPVTLDLSQYGGSKTAEVLESVIQTVEIDSGDVLTEWHSLDHIPVTDTYYALTQKQLDYAHVNTLEADPDDPDVVVVSAKNLSQVFAVDLKSGDIVWRLGGKNPTLKLNADAVDTLEVDGETLPFSYQHDSRFETDGTLRIFDNGQQRPSSDRYSAISYFDIDVAAGTATKLADRQLRTKPDTYAAIQGNAQDVGDGRTFVSWGDRGKATLFDGLAAKISVTLPSTYRAYLAEWHGTPKQPPTATATRSGSAAKVTVSWNGGTDVATWQVRDAANDKVLGTAKWDGYTSTFSVPVPAGVDAVTVRALDRDGKLRKESAEVAVSG